MVLVYLDRVHEPDMKISLYTPHSRPNCNLESQRAVAKITPTMNYLMRTTHKLWREEGQPHTTKHSSCEALSSCLRAYLWRSCFHIRVLFLACRVYTSNCSCSGARPVLRQTNEMWGARSLMVEWPGSRTDADAMWVIVLCLGCWRNTALCC